jgi:hypothetical protein
MQKLQGKAEPLSPRRPEPQVVAHRANRNLDKFGVEQPDPHAPDRIDAMSPSVDGLSLGTRRGKLSIPPGRDGFCFGQPDWFNATGETSPAQSKRVKKKGF